MATPLLLVAIATYLFADSAADVPPDTRPILSLPTTATSLPKSSPAQPTRTEPRLKVVIKPPAIPVTFRELSEPIYGSVSGRRMAFKLIRVPGTTRYECVHVEVGP